MGALEGFWWGLGSYLAPHGVWKALLLRERAEGQRGSSQPPAITERQRSGGFGDCGVVEESRGSLGGGLWGLGGARSL